MRVEAAFANAYSLWWPISFRGFSKLWDSDGTTRMRTVIALLSDKVFKVAAFCQFLLDMAGGCCALLYEMSLRWLQN